MYGTILASLAVVLCYSIFIAIVSRKTENPLWQHGDTVGIPSRGMFGRTYGILASLASTQKYIHDGYARFSRTQSRPYVLPTMWTGGPILVLPRSLLHLLKRPDSQVRAFDAQLETIRIGSLISDRDIYSNLIHFEVLRKHMSHTRDLEMIAPATADELAFAFPKAWGQSSEWTTVNVWDSCGRILMQAAMRAFVGPRLCGDEALLLHSRLFSSSVIMTSMMLNCTPPFLRPILAPLVTWKAKRHLADCLDVLLPLVKERLQTLEAVDGSTDDSNDFLQWMIRRCSEEGPEQLEPTKLATRILLIQTMFVVGMVYVMTHCILDLFGSPLKDEFIRGLQEECHSVQKQVGIQSKRGVDQLHRVDSTIRESMRVSDLNIFALSRDVVSSSIDAGQGFTIPQGTRIVWPTQPIHRDAEFYPNPDTFDAFRFSREFESSDSGATVFTKQVPPLKRQSLTTITQSFLAFGYGKHECPGRWFASQTLKQALAYMLTHYDVQLVGQRAARVALLNVMIPETGAKIRVRRKVV